MEIQNTVLKKIPMEGKIKKENFRKRNISKTAVIPLAVGSIVLGTLAYHHHLETEKNLTFSSNYKSYSAQIEELFNVDISTDNENQLNQLEEVSGLIKRYQSEEETNKENLFQELIEKKKVTEDLCLRILKEDIAKENGGKWDEYTIWQDHAEATWWAEGHGNTITLQGKQDRLVNAIGNCQITGHDNDYEKAKNPDKVVERYEKMILETARFIKNVSSKSK